MVNEMNKPNEPTDNLQLSQSLAASGPALAEMHSQLLAEMEELRQRAEQLEVVRQQQGIVEQSRSEQYEESVEQTATSTIAKSTAIQQMSSKSVQEFSGTSDGDLKALTDEADEADEAEYIKKKMAEIAQLKSQFKKVQNMIDTTEMIEQHLSNHQSVSETIQSEATAKATSKSSLSSMKQQSIEVAQQCSSTTTSSSKSVMEAQLSSSKSVMQSVAKSSTVSVQEEIEESIATSSSGGSITATGSVGGGDEKEQMLVAMLDMFEDFNTDLKSQAESLRSERERIKALKETIIRSRQGSKDGEAK